MKHLRWKTPLAGVLCACVLAECLLRLFATGATVEGMPRGETYRQFSEGVATAHFLPDGSRSTGNPELPGAPTILILGDSHVPAVQIEDEETMGSVLERMARSRGAKLNVRQFGWSGEGYGVARTLAFGPTLQSQYNPTRVIVVLSEGALRTYPADASAAARLQDQPPPSLRGLNRVQRATRWLAHYSVLAHLLYVRFREATLIARNNREDLSSQKCVASADDARLTVLPNLKKTFQQKLLVLYAPTVDLDSPAAPDCWEAMLTLQCRTFQVQCVSLRAAMLEARKSHVITRGFYNTKLGSGHLNRFGHEIAGKVLFETLLDTNNGAAD